MESDVQGMVSDCIYAGNVVVEIVCCVVNVGDLAVLDDVEPCKRRPVRNSEALQAEADSKYGQEIFIG